MIKERYSYIDNLRVLLTVLVILHHTAITYGGPGSWYYAEKNENQLSVILLTLFVATNQAFFMGFFFFLSSFFIPSSYVRKSSTQFIGDRLKRLGVPLIFYSFVIAPVTIYLVLRYANGATYTFVEYYFNRSNWIELGVLWFTAALLIFTIGYWIFKQAQSTMPKTLLPLPGNCFIFLFAIALGVISFFARIIFPVGWALQPFGFQLGHFTQYIFLFMIGIVAFQNNWLQVITYEKGIQWMKVALILLFFGFPFMYFFKVQTNAPLSDFQGGISWSSLISCLWEQVMGISIIVAFLGIGKFKWNKENPLLKIMSRSAYAVYIIHPLVLVSISLLMMSVALPAGLKFAITGTITVLLSFFFCRFLVKTPLISKVV